MMVCPSKTPTDTHGPDCYCDNCRVERILSQFAGWEWVDNGRPAAGKPEPRIPRAWLVVEACAWLLAAVALYLMFWG